MSFSVVDGGYEVANAMHFQPLTQSAQQFFNQLHDQWNQNVSQAGMQYVQQVNEQFNQIAAIDMEAMANALARKHEHFWNDDVIRPLTTIDLLQQCPRSQVRWMMADTYYRRMVLNNQAEGWSDVYINMQGNDIGIDQYDHRLVYNGYQVQQGDDTYLRNFMDVDYDVDGDLLTLENRFDIIESHWHLEAEARMKDRDPGDPWNSKL